MKDSCWPAVCLSVLRVRGWNARVSRTTFPSLRQRIDRKPTGGRVSALPPRALFGQMPQGRFPILTSIHSAPTWVHLFIEPLLKLITISREMLSEASVIHSYSTTQQILNWIFLNKFYTKCFIVICIVFLKIHCMTIWIIS